MSQKIVAIRFLLMSLAAAGLLLFLSWAGPSRGHELAYQDILLVGAVFMISCVFGIVQSARPCGRGKKGHGAPSSESGERRIDRIGHHPGCERFESHVISIGGKSYCSGCLGLGLGSGISLIIMGAFLLFPTIPPRFGLMLSVLGISLTFIGLAETAVHIRRPELHMLANVLLVIGFLMVTIGASVAAGSASYGLLAVLISFLWLDTRIRISDWKHAEICRRCGRDCRSY